MQSGARKALMTWMTVMIYAIFACALVGAGQCCSQHSHDKGEGHGDRDHVIPDSVFDGVALSNLIPLPNQLAWSQKHCCGQGLHVADDRIAFHVVNCQRSTEPSRPPTWLSSSTALCHGQPDSSDLFARAGCSLSRASARSPALESILTVSLLI